MDKYNNLPRAPRADSPMRFIKRPRFTGNISGISNSSTRFKYQNQHIYQYPQNKNSTTDSYKPNHYDNSPNRHSYSNSPNRPSYNFHHQQNKQSPYSHKPTISSSSSPSSSVVSSSPRNVSKFPPSQSNALAAQTESADIVPQNSELAQQQFTPNLVDSPNYYKFGYHFYPPYNVDLGTTTPSTTFRAADGLSAYMWQTITSTPPPKLTVQQPPPPLPQQPPPTLPPLPTSNDTMPHLPRPPPIPVSIADLPSSISTSEAAHQNNKSTDQVSAPKTIIKMKAKRKAVSTRYKLSKNWSEKDAILALKAEETNTRKQQKDVILIIRFPDPEISREKIKSYSPAIESVHFQLNFAPRSCLVHLKPGVDVEKTIDDLSKISFGTGCLSVEIKQIPHKVHSTKLHEVDPFTLYVGNLPTTIACKTLKKHFPGAIRIDIGFAYRMKYTRYAFVRYQSVEQAIEAYKRMLDAEIEGRNLSIRFRRLTSGNKDGEVDNQDEIQDELLTQTSFMPEDNTTNLNKDRSEDINMIDNTNDKNNGQNPNDVPNITEKHTIETAKNGDDTAAQKDCSTESTDLLETIENIPLIKRTNQENSNRLVPNIKPDPDVDPDDIVIRSDATMTSRFKATNNSIKQEEQNLALYMEFFEKPNNEKDGREKSHRCDMHSLASTTNETDTMSSLSSNSLGEFLQSCHRQQTHSDNTEDLEPPPTKVNKVIGDNLQLTIKREPLEKNNTLNRDNSRLLSMHSAVSGTVKQESNQDSGSLNPLKEKQSSEQSICSNTRKTTPLDKQQVSARNNSEDSHNDDIVPPTALFFRNDCQNMVINSTSPCIYDEFYETRVTHSPTVANVKKEPLDTLTKRSANECNKSKQNKTLNQNRITVSSAVFSGEKSGLATTSNAIDDDDLVPANNLLGSYRPLENFIKTETEHDDLFSVPLNKTNHLNESNNSKDHSLTNIRINRSNNCENTTESSQSCTTDYNEDVVIISDNIKRPSKNSRSNNTLLTNLFIPEHTDLVPFTHKPVSVTISKREVSKTIYHDHLDKLYEQLDADSDSEL